MPWLLCFCKAGVCSRSDRRRAWNGPVELELGWVSRSGMNDGDGVRGISAIATMMCVDSFII